MSGIIVPEDGQNGARTRTIPSLTSFTPMASAVRTIAAEEREIVAPTLARRRSAVFTEVARLTDVAAALAAFGLVLVWLWIAQQPDGAPEPILARFAVRNLVLLAMFVLAWQETFFLFGLYDAELPAWRRSETPAILAASAVGSVLALLLDPFGLPERLGLAVAAALWPLSALLALAARSALAAATRAPMARTPRRVLIVGSGPRAARLRDMLARNGAVTTIVGVVDSNEEIASPDVRRALIGELHDLEAILMRQVVDEVLIALPVKSCYAEIQRVIEICERVGVEAKYLADIFQCSLQGSRFDGTGQVPVFAVKVVSDDKRWLLKRAIDIAGALVGLLVLSPILVGIALAVRLTSPGPAIFAQDRYGRRKRLFRMYKFRTMVTNAEALQATLEARNEAAGPVFKIKEDPRVTRLGRFLRRTSLDELPQLLNVLKGDMSLVGPRPLPVRDVHLFRSAWLMRRFSVPPGLTCLWQISGRSNLEFDDWIALDLQYIDQWSLALDLKILAWTIPAVLRGTGAA